MTDEIKPPHLEEPDDIEAWVTNPGHLEELAHEMLKDSPDDQPTIDAAEDAVEEELRASGATFNGVSLAVWCSAFVEQVRLQIRHAKLVARGEDA